MPDLKDRSKREKELAAVILVLFREYESQLPNVNWQEFERRLAGVIGPKLAGTYRAGFERLRDQLGFEYGTDAGSIQRKADAWAKTFGETLAKTVVDTTRERVEAAGEDEESKEGSGLSGDFDGDRAEKIAITETTRANTAGEFGAITAAVGLGIISQNDMGAVWMTADDEKVCEECGPLHGTGQEIWGLVSPSGPPLHPRCRCTLEFDGFEAMESISVTPMQERKSHLDDFPAMDMDHLCHHRFLEVPDIRQGDDFSCGPASAMAVASYFEVGPDTLNQWRHDLKTDVRHTTDPMVLFSGLMAAGLRVQAFVDMTIDDLAQATAAGSPVIVLVQDYGPPKVPAETLTKHGHYLTVIGVGFGHVFAQDSSEDAVIGKTGSVQRPGRVMIEQEKFVGIWHDQDSEGKEYLQFGIVVSGPVKE